MRRLSLSLCCLLIVGALAPTSSYADSHSGASFGAPSVVDFDWLAFPLPAPLYDRWRIYGEWDYKQLGSKYRDATMFNFGATADAAKMTSDGVQKLAKSARATPEDVVALDDPRLIANFNENRAAFNVIAAMAKQDNHVTRLSYDFTSVDEVTLKHGDHVGINDDRWKKYRELFTRLSLREGLVRNEDYPGAILFVYHAKGLCTGGSSNGYMYSPTPPPLVTGKPSIALDEAARAKASKGDAVFIFQELAPD